MTCILELPDVNEVIWNCVSVDVLLVTIEKYHQIQYDTMGKFNQSIGL